MPTAMLYLTRHHAALYDSEKKAFVNNENSEIFVLKFTENNRRKMKNNSYCAYIERPQKFYTPDSTVIFISLSSFRPFLLSHSLLVPFSMILTSPATFTLAFSVLCYFSVFCCFHLLLRIVPFIAISDGQVFGVCSIFTFHIVYLLRTT